LRWIASYAPDGGAHASDTARTITMTPQIMKPTFKNKTKYMLGLIEMVTCVFECYTFVREFACVLRKEPSCCVSQYSCLDAVFMSPHT